MSQISGNFQPYKQKHIQEYIKKIKAQNQQGITRSSDVLVELLKDYCSSDITALFRKFSRHHTTLIQKIFVNYKVVNLANQLNELDKKLEKLAEFNKAGDFYALFVSFFCFYPFVFIPDKTSILSHAWRLGRYLRMHDAQLNEAAFSRDDDYAGMLLSLLEDGKRTQQIFGLISQMKDMNQQTKNRFLAVCPPTMHDYDENIMVAATLAKMNLGLEKYNRTALTVGLWSDADLYFSPSQDNRDPAKIADKERFISIELPALIMLMKQNHDVEVLNSAIKFIFRRILKREDGFMLKVFGTILYSLAKDSQFSQVLMDVFLEQCENFSINPSKTEVGFMNFILSHYEKNPKKTQEIQS